MAKKQIEQPTEPAVMAAVATEENLPASDAYVKVWFWLGYAFWAGMAVFAVLRLAR